MKQTVIVRGRRVYAIPLDANDPNSMWQWYDEFDVPFGGPVLISDIFRVDEIDGGTP